MTPRYIVNIDPAEWARDLWEAKDTYIENLEISGNAVQTMHGVIASRHNSLIKVRQEYKQLPAESVLGYGHRLKEHFMIAGGSLIMLKMVLYDMAWAWVR